MAFPSYDLLPPLQPGQRLLMLITPVELALTQIPPSMQAMQSYFPQELFYELWRSNRIAPPDLSPANPEPSPAPNLESNSEPNPEPNPETNPAPGQAPPALQSSAANSEASHEPNVEADAEADSAANAEANQNANTPPTDTEADQNAHPPSAQPVSRFDVCHSIHYTPWAPTPADARSENWIVGSHNNLREANDRALQEVFEKYGGLAHRGRAFTDPPDPRWIRKASGGATVIEPWPNTWELREDGSLRFKVVNNNLYYSTEAEIYITTRQESAA
ncbi:hypothetical protein F5Y19DRAFT_484858 [Xylariaceae sp. FL1651]|nr:hypothetical protein F5Y19DRAFT_484858 [Xylariaceae sp. FL1651]